ncbi:MAG: DUF1501 domain-containing protein [Planctomycetes bacterium]|nr:DUF1501 domain-containing protein [Planctomycetota bacterium]
MSPLFARRQFLKFGVAGVSVAGALPAFVRKTVAAVERQSDPHDDRILVVVQLSGGNDGISTVVPYGDPAYAAARSSTRIDESSVLRIDEHVGLHPNLKELKGLYDEGRMAIVQGVSYPNPTRSHFEAMDIWNAGDLSGARRGSGWLGRALDQLVKQADPTAGVNVGNKVALAMVGERIKPVAFEDPDRYRWRGRSTQYDAFKAFNGETPDAMPEKGADSKVGELDFLLRVAHGADESSAAIRKAVTGYQTSASYPENNNRLAPGLRNIAAMIAGGLTTRVYYASLGGFDTHANQRATHDNLMTAFSGAVSAFMGDLGAKKLLDRVTILAFTEFGRRVKENGSRGTDHGVAGPMFVFGGRVHGGLFGKYPSLTDLDKGDLKMAVDFRRVYATILDRWLGADSKAVLGAAHEPLKFLA